MQRSTSTKMAVFLLGINALGCNSSDFSASSNVAVVETQEEPAKKSEDIRVEEPAPADVPAPNPPAPPAPEKLEKLPKIGLLVNDLQCGLCHVKIIGDVGSTRDVSPVWPNSNVTVAGTWFAAKAFNANNPAAVTPNLFGLGLNVTVAVSGGIKTAYSGPEVPAAFPNPAFADLAPKMRGTAAATMPSAVNLSKSHNGNVVMIGTKDQPIQINSDVLINGDLVIAGYYKGIGTLYVTGNIYVPADLKAVKSAFPFPEDVAQAKARAMEVVKDKSYDGLGLVAQNSIFLGDLEKFEPGNVPAFSVYNHPFTPADRTYAALKVLGVYQWFPGGKAEFDKLYGSAPDCYTLAPRAASISLIESFLYAGNTIAGVARSSSYSIRGGVIADHFHIISGAQVCPATTMSPSHGRPMNKNYIEYDYRLQTELFPLVERLADKPKS